MKPLYLKGFCFLNLSYIMDISRPWSSATAGTVSNSYFFFPWLYFLDLMDSFTYISDSLILCVRLIQYCKQFLKILGRFFTAIWFGQPLICLMYPILRCFFYFILVRKPKWSKVHHKAAYILCQSQDIFHCFFLHVFILSHDYRWDFFVLPRCTTIFLISWRIFFVLLLGKANIAASSTVRLSYRNALFMVRIW